MLIGLNQAGTFKRTNYETSNAISHLRVLSPSNSQSKQVGELTTYIHHDVRMDSFSPCSLSAFDIDNITIRLGDHNLKRIHETRHAVRRVRRIVRNKTFNTSTLHGDIAIIQVT